MEHGIHKRKIIAELIRSPHGDLAEYLPVGRQAAEEEGEFFAHLIAWNQEKGHIRDSKVALPVASLTVPSFNGELRENSLAHLALLSPRDLLRALLLTRSIHDCPRRPVRRLVRRYLREREAVQGRWEMAAISDRRSMKALYVETRTRPAAFADQLLFKRARMPGSLFEAVARLSILDDTEAAGVILKRRIPFLVAKGALGARFKSEAVLMALIDQMTPTQLVTNAGFLKRHGVENSPALRAAFEAALENAAKSKKAPLKTAKAAKVTKGKTAKKLAALGERQIDAASLQGDWLVLGDCSYSMQRSIGMACEIAATLARYAAGQVHLVFFDTTPRAVDATDKTLEELTALAHRVRAGGNTSIGCGLRWALEKGIEVDGIALASDGGENTAPWFAQEYERYCRRYDNEPPVYLYEVEGDPNRLAQNMSNAGHDLQILPLRGKTTDSYSLPTLVQTMRASRYSLTDEIMETPLRKLSDVFTHA